MIKVKWKQFGFTFRDGIALKRNVGDVDFVSKIQAERGVLSGNYEIMNQAEQGIKKVSEPPKDEDTKIIKRKKKRRKKQWLS